MCLNTGLKRNVESLNCFLKQTLFQIHHIVFGFCFLLCMPVKPVVELVRNVTSENICIGTIVNLTCKADANPPVDNYALYKNNEVVAQGQEIIYIDTRVASIGSRGQYIYTCETNNSVGTGQSSNTTLTVGDKYEAAVFKDI